ncbi:MAG: hypothetical protein HKO59_12890 [Phycisphaerales bacterium]|nr:hypothetical protein [Phycisphaerales bacterium]
MIDLGDVGFLVNPDKHGSFGINDKGQVAFAVLDGGFTKAALWLPAKAFGIDPGTFIPNLPGMTSHPSIFRGCNESGVFVGEGADLDGGDGDAIVFLFSETSVISLVLDPSDSDSDWARAMSVNDTNPPVILGQWQVNSNCDPCGGTPPEAYFRSVYVALQGGSPTTWSYFEVDPSPEPGRCDPASPGNDISTLSPISFRIAGASGTHNVVGKFTCIVGDSYAPKPIGWTPAVNELDREADLGSEARGVNDNGEFVGWEFEDTFLNPRRARHWSSLTASFFNLGSVMPAGQDDDRSWEAISNHALPKVVGWNEDDDRALLWESQSSPQPPWIVTDLNDAIPDCWDGEIELQQAHDINGFEWIVAYGDGDVGTPGVQPHAFVLIPLNGCSDADFDGDGVVGFLDLVTLLAAWGPCTGCAPDIDEDGEVVFLDLLFLLSRWGLCPTGGNSPVGPPTFEEELADAGLDAADWAVFEDCLANGSDEEAKNCACWLEHYLKDCVPSCRNLPDCEGADPLQNH